MSASYTTPHARVLLRREVEHYVSELAPEGCDLTAMFTAVNHTCTERPAARSGANGHGQVCAVLRSPYVSTRG